MPASYPSHWQTAPDSPAVYDSRAVAALLALSKELAELLGDKGYRMLRKRVLRVIAEVERSAAPAGRVD